MNMVRRTLLVLILVGSMALAAPGGADSHGGGYGPPPYQYDGGCAATGSAQVAAVQGPNSCSYLSHGPGVFSGQASAGWCINVWRDWVRVAQYCHDWNYYSGQLNTQEGDIVEVILHQYCLANQQGPYSPCYAGIYPGYVTAGDTGS